MDSPQPFSPADSADPASTPGRGWADKMTGAVASRPGLALAVIVVLALAIVYLVLKERGWLGGRRGFSRPLRAKDKDEDPEDPEDPGDDEIDDLISSINGGS